MNFAFLGLIVSLAAVDVDRDALREQASMPAYSFRWDLSDVLGGNTLVKYEAAQLARLKRPSPHQLFRLAELENKLDNKASQKHYRQAIPLLKKLALKDPSAELELVIALVRSGRPKVGKAMAERMSERHPGSWRAWVALGIAKSDLDSKDLAGFSFDSSGLSKELKRALNSRKAVIAEARTAFDKAVSLAPLEPEAYRYRFDFGSTATWITVLATISDTQDTTAAGNLFTSTLESVVADVRRAALLDGRLQDRLTAVQLGALVELMRYGIENQGMNEEEISTAIPDEKKQELLGMLDKAIGQARSLPKAQRAEIYRSNGPVYFALGRADKGILLTEQAAQDQPNDEKSALTHVDLMLMAKNFAAGAAAGQRYLTQHPSWTQVRMHTAKALEHEKQYAAALDLMEQRLKQNPKDVPAMISAASFRLRLPNYAGSLPSVAATAKRLDDLKLDDREQRTEAAILHAICLGLYGKVDQAKALLESLDAGEDSTLQERIDAALAALG